MHAKLKAQIYHYAGTEFLMGRAVSIAIELFSVLHISRPWVIQSVHVQNLGKKLTVHSMVILINSVLPLQLVALALPFGQVKNVLLLKSKKLNEATQVSVT